MNNKIWKQNALQKLDAIYAIKKSMDKWLTLWAEEYCPVQVGDKFPIWEYGNREKDIIVSKVTAKLVPDRKFVWQIEGWDGVNKHTEIIDMEE